MSSSVVVSRVLVKDGWASGAAVRGAAQELQYLEVSEFSVWHLGHIMGQDPFNENKNIHSKGNSQQGSKADSSVFLDLMTVSCIVFFYICIGVCLFSFSHQFCLVVRFNHFQIVIHSVMGAGRDIMS